jgi:hypothetical protein
MTSKSIVEARRFLCCFIFAGVIVSQYRKDTYCTVYVTVDGRAGAQRIMAGT